MSSSFLIKSTLLKLGIFNEGEESIESVPSSDIVEIKLGSTVAVSNPRVEEEYYFLAIRNVQKDREMIVISLGDPHEFENHESSLKDGELLNRIRMFDYYCSKGPP